MIWASELAGGRAADGRVQDRLSLGVRRPGHGRLPGKGQAKAGDASVSVKVRADDGAFNADMDRDMAKVRALGAETAKPKVDSSSVKDAGSWMGLLVTSAAAVAPEAITAGLGLAVFGGAALPVIKQAVKGTGQLKDSVGQLKTEYSDLTAAVQPVAIQAFNNALDQAQGILPEFTGDAIAGGNALNGFFSQFGDFMQSGTAQQFLGFVQNQVGPDVHALGNLLDGAAGGAMGLTEALNPLGKALVNTAGGALSLVGATARTEPGLTEAAVAATGLYLAYQKLAATSLGEWFAGAIPEAAAFASVLAGVRSAEDAAAAGELALEAVSPVGWAIAGAAAIGVLGTVLLKDTPTVDGFTAALQRQDDATGFNVAGYQRLAAQTTATAAETGKLGQAVQQTAPAMLRARVGAAAYSGATAHVAMVHQQAITSARNLGSDLGQLQRVFGLTRAQAIDLAQGAGVSANALAAGGSKAQGAMQKIEKYALAGAQATTQSTQLAVETGILGSQLSDAARKADALSSAFSALVDPQLSLMNDTVAFRQAQVTLASALSKSHDVLGTSTAAQRTATSAATTAASAALEQSHQILAMTGSNQKAIRPLQTLVDQFD
jgi:hypothetical protein